MIPVCYHNRGQPLSLLYSLHKRLLKFQQLLLAPTIQPSIATTDSKAIPPVATAAATIKAPTATPARNVNRPPHFFIGILQTNVSEIFLSSIFSNGNFEAVLITLPSLSTLHISRWCSAGHISTNYIRTMSYIGLSHNLNCISQSSYL